MSLINTATFHLVYAEIGFFFTDILSVAEYILVVEKESGQQVTKILLVNISYLPGING